MDIVIDQGKERNEDSKVGGAETWAAAESEQEGLLVTWHWTGHVLPGGDGVRDRGAREMPDHICPLDGNYAAVSWSQGENPTDQWGVHSRVCTPAVPCTSMW